MPYAIHCETEELARQVLQIAHDAGLRWVHAKEFPALYEKPSIVLSGINWVGLDYFAFNFDDGCITWSTSDYWISLGYTIVKAQDFIDAHTSSTRKSAENP